VPDPRVAFRPAGFVATALPSIETRCGFIAKRVRHGAAPPTFAAMTSTTNPTAPRSQPPLLPALLTGGVAAGVLDAASAFHDFGWGMPYGIASGLLGSRAFPDAGGGGTAIWILGLALHFTIAIGAAAVYCVASQRLVSLQHHFIVGGVLCGVGVYLAMMLIVLPMSAVPFPVGPFTVEGLRVGLLFHILLIGLPISGSRWWFSRRTPRPA